MTRKEIVERASEIACHFSESPKQSDYLEVKRIVLEVVRAAMEADARAVCPDCEVALAEQENVADATFFWSHTDRSSAGPWRRKVCPAAPIHDLIAALDGGGEND